MFPSCLFIYIAQSPIIECNAVQAPTHFRASWSNSCHLFTPVASGRVTKTTDNLLRLCCILVPARSLCTKCTGAYSFATDSKERQRRDSTETRRKELQEPNPTLYLKPGNVWTAHTRYMTMVGHKANDFLFFILWFLKQRNVLPGVDTSCCRGKRQARPTGHDKWNFFLKGQCMMTDAGRN